MPASYDPFTEPGNDARILWDFDRLARALDVAHITVRRMVKNGTFQSVKIGARHLVTDESVRAYIQDQVRHKHAS